MKKDGKIVLYCKGADSKIKERLDASESTVTKNLVNIIHYSDHNPFSTTYYYNNLKNINMQNIKKVNRIVMDERSVATKVPNSNKSLSPTNNSL